MENLDVMVLRTLRDWRAAGQRALLATVVRTWGSSPRPIGSIMALSESGAVVGSVSGGCIEDDLIYRFTQAYAQGNAGQGEDKHIPSGAPGFVKYGISADEARKRIRLVMLANDVSLRNLVPGEIAGSVQAAFAWIELSPDRAHLRPAAGRLTQTLGDQWMIFAQERPDHQHAVQLR